MNLTWLGTGSAFNFGDGNVSSVMRVGGRLLLFDCGFSVPRALKDLGLLEQVTDIFISHTHSDHIGGLELLAQWRYFVSQRHGVHVPNLIVTPDILDSLRALESLGLGHIQDDHGRPVKATLETYFDIKVLRVHERMLFDVPRRDPDPSERLTFRYQKADHVPGGYPAYSFDLEIGRKVGDDVQNRSIYLTADTRRVVTGPYDLVFHDCQLYTGPNDGAGDVHASLDTLIAKVPSEVRNRYFLVHYGANIGNPAIQAKIKEAGFGGVVVAGDMMNLWNVGPLEPIVVVESPNL